MRRLGESIQGLFNGFATFCQVSLCLRIFLIAVQVEFISTGAEHFRWKNIGYGREEVGCKGGRVCRGDAELSGGRFVGEGFPWSGPSTSDVLWM